MPFAEKTPLSALLTRYAQEITPCREITSHVPEKSRLKTLAGLLGDYTAAGTTSEHVVHYVRARRGQAPPVALGVAMLAPLADLGAAGDGVPR